MFVRVKSFTNYIISFGLCILFFIASFLKVSAETSKDLDKKASIKIEYLKGKPAEGVEFKIYKIADLSGDSDYIFADLFKLYEKHLSFENEDDLDKCASVFAMYVKRDGLEADRVESLDRNNVVSFEGLDLGVYLITADKIGIGKRIYRHKPFIVRVPKFAKDTWIYDLYEYANYTYTEIAPNESIYRKALIVWEDSGFESDRPKNVEVQVLRDGDLYSCISLNEENNWRYSAGPFSSFHEWEIIQKDVPDGYVSSVKRIGRTFVIKNKYVLTDKCDVRNSAVKDEFKASLESDELCGALLPKIGLLWWPVPILICSGVVLFAYGVIKDNGKC